MGQGRLPQPPSQERPPGTLSCNPIPSAPLIAGWAAARQVVANWQVDVFSVRRCRSLMIDLGWPGAPRGRREHSGCFRTPVPGLASPHDRRRRTSARRTQDRTSAWAVRLHCGWHAGDGPQRRTTSTGRSTATSSPSSSQCLPLSRLGFHATAQEDQRDSCRPAHLPGSGADQWTPRAPGPISSEPLSARDPGRQAARAGPSRPAE
jgi:hypothetical protein